VKARDLREMTSDELQVQMKQRMDVMVAFRLQMTTGVVDNVRGARNARRDIARIKTILRQREMAAKGTK
jgi:large subunit ribosomal protein L29